MAVRKKSTERSSQGSATSSPAGPRPKQRSAFWSRLHFLVRFLGLTGFLAAALGVILIAAVISWSAIDWQSIQSVWSALQSGITQSPDIIQGKSGLFQQIAVSLIVGGLIALAIMLLVEAFVVLTMAAGRRSAFGMNVVLQVILALILLGGINLYSFFNYGRLGKQEFDLPGKVQDDLKKLKSPTTIVVLQKHKSFGQLKDTPDAYDYAAEREVVKKVRDLVDELREVGPQFRVVLLDTEDEHYADRLARLTQDPSAKPLREAIESAPENSIFFFGNGQVQRMSFTDFYQLDKVASQEANGGKGNLVLLAQGVEPFVGKVLAVDQRRPRVAIAVVHNYLTTQGPIKEFGLKQLRRTLEANGFEVRDVVLRKNVGGGLSNDPAAFTFEESKLDSMETIAKVIDRNIDLNERRQKLFPEMIEDWKTLPEAKLKEKYDDFIRFNRITDFAKADRQEVAEQLEKRLKETESDLAKLRDRRASLKEEMEGLKAESLAEKNRLGDMRAKMNRVLEDCDLLIIPRMTIRSVARGEAFDNDRFFRLDADQVEAIKDFMKAGKSVLVCFGPLNLPGSEGRPPFQPPSPSRVLDPDDLEKLFTELGIEFGKETVLFKSELESLAESQGGQSGLGTVVHVPPVEFQKPPGGKPSAKDLKPNPIRESMRLTQRSVGKDQVFDLRIEHPRPVDYKPPTGDKKAGASKIEAEFIFTNPAGWKEIAPFPTSTYLPESKVENEGSFPIGSAIETQLPQEWFADAKTDPPVVRVAAIGQGSFFVDAEMTPAKERLLVHTCNWLVHRDNLLPQSSTEWKYPRVQLSQRDKSLWEWGALLGLPGLFFYLGIVVLLVRRLR